MLRVLQYNTHHGGWGSDGVYSPDRIADWIVKSNADLVSLNEIEVKDSWSKNLDQSVVYRDLLQQKTGVTWYTVFVNAHGATTGIGNLVLSKFPFIATATYQLSDGRAAVDATVDVNGRTINFTSVHLDSETAVEPRSRKSPNCCRGKPGWRKTASSCGDFNAWPDDDGNRDDEDDLRRHVAGGPGARHRDRQRHHPRLAPDRLHLPVEERGEPDAGQPADLRDGRRQRRHAVGP